MCGLQGTRHRDDEDMLVYEVTNVYVLRSTSDIVGKQSPSVERWIVIYQGGV